MNSNYFGTDEDAKVWFNKDSEGIAMSLLVQGILLFTYISQMIIFIPVISFNSSKRFILQTVITLLYLITAYCHICCVFCNPGAVPHNAYPLTELSCEDGELLQRCGICDAFKPRKSHHCKVCNRCILKMDHHCPWINNCVGMLNMKFFLLFLFYTFLLCILVFVCTIIAVIQGVYSSNSVRTIVVSVSVVFSLLYSCLFGVFSIVILVETLITAVTGETKIDRLKELHQRHKNNTVNLSEVFGGQGTFSWTWLLPTKPKYQNFEYLAEYVLDPSGKHWNIYGGDSEWRV